MFLPNGVGVFVLGILTGWVLDVNLIASASYLLSELPASDAIVVQITGGFLAVRWASATPSARKLRRPRASGPVLPEIRTFCSYPTWKPATC